MTDAPLPAENLPLKSLSRAQRRVLGTLIEKGLTVPESYPLTLKALTSGCNQKSNRDPVTNYSEDDVAETANELRELGLAAVVHTETGRTERYRHYLRRRMEQLSEPQVAILAELLLRGRQSIGDLRARASRMAPAGSLDGLEQLRTELSGLHEQQLIQSDGPLDRRGVEIDHNLYEPQEGRRMTPRAAFDEPVSPPSTSVAAGAPPLASSSAATAPLPAAASGGMAPSASRPPLAHESDSELLSRVAALESLCSALRTANHDTQAEIGALRDEVDRLKDELRTLREALGA